MTKSVARGCQTLSPRENPLKTSAFGCTFWVRAPRIARKGLTNFVTAGTGCSRATRRNPRKTVGFELGTRLELAQSVATMRRRNSGSFGSLKTWCLKNAPAIVAGSRAPRTRKGRDTGRVRFPPRGPLTLPIAGISRSPVDSATPEKGSREVQALRASRDGATTHAISVVVASSTVRQSVHAAKPKPLRGGRRNSQWCEANWVEDRLYD